MDFLEKDLEQIIYEATEEQLEKFKFPYGIKKRQLRIGNYGVADLVFFKRVSVGYYKTDSNNKRFPKTEVVGLCITVCELKKEKVGISAFLQAISYCKGISEYLEERNFHDFYFNILLVGKDIDKSGSFIYLTDLIGNDNRYSNEGVDYEGNYNPYSYFSKNINSIKFKTYSYNFDGIKFKDHQGYNNLNIR